MELDEREAGEVYLITNTANGKHYIGQTSCRMPSGRKYGTQYRWRQHVRCSKTSQDCPYLSNAIQKYGEKSFKIEVLVKCNKSQLNYYEVKFIELYGCIYPNGYNLMSGGSACGRHNEVSKKKLSVANRGKHISLESKANLDDAMAQLNVIELPMGVAYTSCKDRKYPYEGFNVAEKQGLKSFISTSLSLTSKLRYALEYHILMSNNEDTTLLMRQYDEEVHNHKPIVNTDEKLLEALNELNLPKLPLFIRYVKTRNQLYVKVPGKKQKYFDTLKEPLTEIIKKAIEYKDQIIGEVAADL